MLIQVAAPTVLLGLLLCGACLVSFWYVNRLQANLTNILAQDVTSMRAAQQMEISARQFRFRCFVYLIAPDRSMLREIEDSQERFEGWLIQAEQSGTTPREKTQLKAVREGYDEYLREFETQRKEVESSTPRQNYRELANAHLITHITDPCREYLRLNEEMM